MSMLHVKSIELILANGVYKAKHCPTTSKTNKSLVIIIAIYLLVLCRFLDRFLDVVLFVLGVVEGVLSRLIVFVLAPCSALRGADHDTATLTLRRPELLQIHRVIEQVIGRIIRILTLRRALALTDRRRRDRR